MKKLFIAVLLFFPLTSLAVFDRNLYYGIKGDSQVQELQEFLTEQGVYSGPITGNFFALTQKAVKNFQTANLISPSSGYFGPLSRAKANSILGSVTDESGISISPATTSPKTNDDVVAKLNEQIAVLLAQVDELKKNQASLGAIQQQVTNQQNTLNQIQTNTTPAPVPILVPEMDKSEIFVQVEGPVGLIPNYIFRVHVLGKDGKNNKGAPVNWTNPADNDYKSESQEKYMGESVDFSYQPSRPTMSGNRSITFTSGTLSKIIIIDVK